MKKRNIVNSPRLVGLKKHRRRVFINKILLFIVAFLLIFYGLAYISRAPVFNISLVKVISAKTIDAEIIKTSVMKKIEGNYLWFFPKTNIFFYPKKNIKKELHNQFERIKNVTFSVKNDKTLEILVTAREAKYTWCGDSVDLVVEAPSGDSNTEKEKCYFMDENGYIFDEAPYFSGDIYFKFYGLARTAMAEGLTNHVNISPVGASFFNERFFELVLFKDNLTRMDLKPVSLYKKENGDIKIFLSSSSTTQSEIILKAGSDFEAVIENLETAISTEPLKSNLKNKYSSLEYIDLRFGNKVYYKFR